MDKNVMTPPGGGPIGTRTNEIIDISHMPIHTISLLNQVNQAFLKLESYKSTLVLPSQQVPGMVDTLYGAINITIKDSDGNSSNNNNSSSSSSTSKVLERVKLSTIPRCVFLETQEYVKRREYLIKRLHLIKSNRTFKSGFSIRAIDDTIPTLFHDETYLDAYHDLLCDVALYLEIYGMCAFCVPQNILQWATDKNVFEKYDYAKDDDKKIPSFGSKSQRPIHPNNTTELLPFTVEDIAHLGSVTVYKNTRTRAIEYELESPTTVATELQRRNRILIFCPGGAGAEGDGSGRINTQVYAMMKRYKEIYFYENLQRSVASQLSKQLGVVNTHIKTRDINDMSENQLSIIARSRAENMIPTSSSSSGGGGGISEEDQLAAETYVSVDAAKGISILSQLERPTPKNMMDTSLNPSSVQTNLGDAVYVSIEEISFDTLDMIGRGLCDLPNNQALGFLKSIARLPDGFSLANLSRPEFNIDMARMRAEYRHDLANALGVPPSYIDAIEKSDRRKTIADNEKSSMDSAFDAEIASVQNQMMRSFNFVYNETWAVIDRHKIKDIIQRVKDMAGRTMFELDTYEEIRRMLDEGYHSLSEPLQDENTKIRDTAQTLKARLSALIEESKLDNRVKWARDNHDGIMRILAVLEAALNRNIRVRLVFSSPPSSTTTTPQQK